MPCLPVVDEGSGRRAVALPLPVLSAGLIGAEGVMTQDVETRPLFGTYTLALGERSLSDVDPNNFEAELHFVAVGLP